MLSVVSDGFDGAVFKGLVALLKLVLIIGLLVADVVVLIVTHAEVVGCCIRAHTAEDALRIDVEGHLLSTNIINLHKVLDDSMIKMAVYL